MTDWRDGVERLEATSAARDLQPLLDAMKPGQRVALVVPTIYAIGRWSAPWTRLVRLRSEEWLQHISNDPALRVGRDRARAAVPGEPESGAGARLRQALTRSRLAAAAARPASGRCAA